MLFSGNSDAVSCFGTFDASFVTQPFGNLVHAKAATAEGLTFSDPIHKKSARNLNLYNFCHSAKKLTELFSDTKLRMFTFCTCNMAAREYLFTTLFL
jgi:hypothetical protein